MIQNGKVKCSFIRSFYSLRWIQIIQSKSDYQNRKVFIYKYNFHFFHLYLGRYSYANTISSFNDLCLASFTRAASQNAEDEPTRGQNHVSTSMKMVLSKEGLHLMQLEQSMIYLNWQNSQIQQVF